MSEMDELVDRLSTAVAGAVRKAMDDAQQPTVDDRFAALEGRFDDLIEALSAGEMDEGVDEGGSLEKAAGISATDLHGALTEINNNQVALAGAVEKMLERLEGVEKGMTGRKSLDGQDGAGGSGTVQKGASSLDRALGQLGKNLRNGQAGTLTLR